MSDIEVELASEIRILSLKSVKLSKADPDKPNIWDNLSIEIVDYITKNPERILTLLAASGFQDEHIIQVDSGHFVIQHSLSCRMKEEMFTCRYTKLAAKFSEYTSGTFKMNIHENKLHLNPIKGVKV